MGSDSKERVCDCLVAKYRNLKGRSSETMRWHMCYVVCTARRKAGLERLCAAHNDAPDKGGAK